jgi:thiol-disulfide isomerase/thioredoxin
MLCALNAGNSLLLARTAQWALLLALALVSVGCSKSETPSEAHAASSAGSSPAADEAPTANDDEPASDPIPAESPRKVMDDMAGAYAKATSYSDRGKIDFQVQRAGAEPFRDDPDISVSFVRPNKLRLRMYGSMWISDGKQAYALVGDEHFDGDVLQVDAPRELTLDDVYRDEVANFYLTQGIAGGSVQLMLLIGQDPLEALLDGSQDLKLLDPEKFENRWCHRVQVQREDGPLVFWVDQRDHVLRRIDFPTEGLRKRMSEENNELFGEVTLRAEFREARLNRPVADALFEFEVPAKATLVKRFNPRKAEDPPAPPSSGLGKQVADFKFTDLDGQEVTRESLAGKVVVLDFWATWCGPCRESLPNLEKVYHKFQDREGIKFLAVNLDSTDVANVNLLKMFDELGVTMPIVRGGDAQESLTAFGLSPLLPNLVVLGPDGVMQDNEVGYNPKLVAELPARLEKLLAGDSLHQDAMARYELKLLEHQEAINKPLPEQSASGEMPQAEIAPRGEPATFKISKLWTSAEVEQPGNILVVEQPGSGPVILVQQGWKNVAELDGAGKLVGNHKLDIPAESVVAILRTGVNGDGKRLYLGLASAQPQVHVFDETWQRVFSFPEATANVAVADALLADLDGDQQQALYVSYWDVAGVQRVNMDGQRQWGQRDLLQDVYRLATTGPDDAGQADLLATNGGQNNALVLLDSQGQSKKQFSVGNRFIRMIASADLNGDGTMEYCGLAPTPEGHETIVGFDLTGAELWEQPLAPGVHESPLEMITTCRLADGPATHWLIAGPDGRVLIVDAAGQLVDSFPYGSALMGIASTTIDGQPALLFSTPEGVEAWKIEP